MSAFESYVKRPVTFIRQLDVDYWRVKIYGLSAVSNDISDGLAATAIHNIPTYLPSPAINEHRYGVGFVVIHRGTLRNWFLLDWWEHGDILVHKLFSSPLNDPEKISLEKEIPAIACVHELRVINFESKAWIENVLRANPSLDDYMSCTFDDDAKAA